MSRAKRHNPQQNKALPRSGPPVTPTWIKVTLNEVDPGASGVKGFILNPIDEWNRLVCDHARWVHHSLGRAN